LRHKWFVFLECCKLGIPWRGIVHDLSKFRPSEWVPYCGFFYGGGPEVWAEGFDSAWLAHQNRNPHHWQWWVLQEDDGGEKVLDMPMQYRKEMLADWVGAGKAIWGKNSNTKEWYLRNRDVMKLSEAIRRYQTLGGGAAGNRRGGSDR